MDETEILESQKRELDQEITVLMGLVSGLDLTEYSEARVKHTVERLLMTKAKLERELAAMRYRTVSIDEIMARERARLFGD